MPVTRLFLVRHGQSAGNAAGRFGGHGPTPLSELGVQQAERTAKALLEENITAIYSSDLYRAVQTAEPLSRMTGIPVHTKAEFRERNVGVLEGLTFEESRQRYPDDYFALVRRNLDYTITGGESYRDLIHRTMKQLWKVVGKHSGGRIVIFSHTGAICFMTLSLLGAIRRSSKTAPWITTSNCGITRFEIRGRRNIRLLAVNDTSHLTEKTGNDSFAAL
jgi:probable phosphoglycerate mutase